MEKITEKTLVDYYQKDNFNPVPINVEDKEIWRTHFSKRFNLYQRHLGIPLSLINNHQVLEFACNSGENSLVLAYFGANLTLVEPNEQVLPRLKLLFEKFNFEKSIFKLEQNDLENFKSEKTYDVVLAEGFLFTLPNREEMLRKICSFLKEGGLAVTSFEDKFGSLLELTKRMILKRTCELKEVNFFSEESIKLAKTIFLKDFMKINKSRPFEVWWKDSLVTPFFGFKYLWSYPEIMQLLTKENCEFYSSSPKWASNDHFQWYKNTSNEKEYYESIINNWKNGFSFFLTGLPLINQEIIPTTEELIKAVSELIMQIANYTTEQNYSVNNIIYPVILDEYFKKFKNPKIIKLSEEIKIIFNAVKYFPLNNLIGSYHETTELRNLWGTPYHYICFSKKIEKDKF